MDAAECIMGVSSPREGMHVLFEAMTCFKPTRVIEIGSAFGVGSMYLAEALQQNGCGRLYGIEYEQWRCDIANASLAGHWKGTATIYCGRAEDLVPTLAADHGQFDFAFVDAVHKYEDTMGYHGLLRDSVGAGAIAIYDDINWSDGMGRFWADLQADPSITDSVLVNGRWGCVRYRGIDPTHIE